MNAFGSREQVVRIVEQQTGLRLKGTRTLFTSLSFLHPRNRGRAIRMLPLKLAREHTLRWINWLIRWMDRRFGTRASIYGWAFYFGVVHERVETTPWTNVCVRCGSGHPSAALTAQGAIRPGWWIHRFRCLRCNTWNLYTRDDEFRDAK